VAGPFDELEEQAGVNTAIAALNPATIIALVMRGFNSKSFRDRVLCYWDNPE
jgi:hypothetical protein